MDTIIEETKKETIWVIAQSNIAVKNIAEKLYSCSFREFRILVSGDFINEWWVEYLLITTISLMTI